MDKVDTADLQTVAIAAIKLARNLNSMDAIQHLGTWRTFIFEMTDGIFIRGFQNFGEISKQR